MARGVRTPTLSERVTIERAVETKTDRGGRTVTWSAIEPTPTMWAEVIGLTGDEAIAAGAARSVQRWRVTIRLRRDVASKDRLRWRDLTLDVKSVVPTPDRRWLVMICESGLKA